MKYRFGFVSNSSSSSFCISVEGLTEKDIRFIEHFLEMMDHGNAEYRGSQNITFYTDTGKIYFDYSDHEFDRKILNMFFEKIGYLNRLKIEDNGEWK